MKDNHWEDQFKAQKVEEPRILSGHDFNNFVPDQKRQFQGKSYETFFFYNGLIGLSFFVYINWKL